MEWAREELQVPGFERVVYAREASTGLSAIVAIHSTALGPACGGIRMLPYASREEALEDVLRLSRGMSFKSALAGIGFGGGKSVILGDPARKTPALFEAMGEFIDSFDGAYIGAKDMNVTSDDLEAAKRRSRHVLGIVGEPGSSGDPSPVTARGVFRAMEATWQELRGTRSLEGVRVALQGVGYVGMPLARLIREAGGELIVTDVNPQALRQASEELQASVVDLDRIYDVECDIFSPCARGAVLNSATIPRLKCQAVVGAANNQLREPADGWALQERGILYAPDFAVNSGGIINIFVEYEGYDESRALHKADGIFDTMREIFERSRQEGQPPFVLADRIAQERIAAARP